MRIVLALLLFANLTLYAYTRLDMGTGEGVLLQDQVQPDKIKLLTPQQVAALGPTKVAALADVCVEWGPFSDADRGRALADLEPLALGRLLSQKRVEYVPPRQQAIAQTLLVVRDPQQAVVARLKDLQAQYPGSEIKVTACERTG
jgi:hypothetical protein